MIKVRAKTVVKLCSETVNSTIEFQKGTTLSAVFQTLTCFVYDAETLAEIQVHLNKARERVMPAPPIASGEDRSASGAIGQP